MSKVFAMVSQKGGTGKTTITSFLGTKLVSMGKKVLLLDLACGFRSLDLFLGAENMCMSHLFDVLSGAEALEEAVIEAKGLHYLPAPVLKQPEDISEKPFADLIALAREIYDVVLIDLPGGYERFLLPQIHLADSVLYVINQDPACLRGIDSLQRMFNEKSVCDSKIIANRWHFHTPESERVTSADMLGWHTGLSIAGLIAESETIRNQVLTGEPELLAGSQEDQAFYTLAKNLLEDTFISEDELKAVSTKVSEEKKKGFLSGIAALFTRK